MTRAILSAAVEDDIVVASLCRMKNAGRQVTPERPVVMPEEVAKIVACIDGRYRAMVLLGAYCSLRIAGRTLPRGKAT